MTAGILLENSSCRACPARMLRVWNLSLWDHRQHLKTSNAEIKQQMVDEMWVGS